jgi:hypothetical protein
LAFIGPITSPLKTTKYEKFRQVSCNVWKSLEKFGKVWESLEKFGEFFKFGSLVPPFAFDYRTHKITPETTKNEKFRQV